MSNQQQAGETRFLQVLKQFVTNFALSIHPGQNIRTRYEQYAAINKMAVAVLLCEAQAPAPAPEAGATEDDTLQELSDLIENIVVEFKQFGQDASVERFGQMALLRVNKLRTRQANTIEKQVAQAMPDLIDAEVMEAKAVNQKANEAANQYVKDHEETFRILIAESDFTKATIEQWSHADYYDGYLAGHTEGEKEAVGKASVIIEDLLEAIPKQTEDADWWDGELVRAVENAKKFIDTLYKNQK